MADPRHKLLTAATEAVRKRYKQALTGPASRELELPSVFVSTGSLALDRVCAGRTPGGFPIGRRHGRIIHVPGDWSTGKTVLLDCLFKSVTDLGGLGYVAETEGTRDPHFPEAIGLDLSLLQVDRPTTIEALFDHAFEWHDNIRGRKGGATIPLLVGVDSLDSTEAGKSAREGLSEGGGWHYGGGRSEALSAGLRKAVQRTARYPTTFVLLNQTRDRVGTFVPQKTTSGGNPPHFYASLELWLSRSPLGDVRGTYRGTPLSPALRKKLGFGPTDLGGIVGRWVRGKITKTKIAPTYLQSADFYIDFARGIHLWGGLAQQMIREGRLAIKDEGTCSFIRIATGEIVDFDSLAAWTTWVAQNPDELEPSGKGG